MNIEQKKQQLTPGRRVELFDLDASSIVSGAVYHFCSSFAESLPLLWGGVTYVPIPILSDGFEVSGQGRLPTPTIKIGNIGNFVSTLLLEVGDIVGAKVTRRVTFSDFLDNGTTPDTSQHFIPEIFRIERKKSHTREAVEFELSASIDQEGHQLPGRQIIPSACTHIYRTFAPSAGQFDYSKATCPYVGSDLVQGGTEGPFFDALGQQTGSPSLDRCGKRLSDCRLRFTPLRLPLPFAGFPGVGRITQ